MNAPFTVSCSTGIIHHPGRRPDGIMKADRESGKPDDLLKRDFHAGGPLTECITDITQIRGRDGKPYVSAIFDCSGSGVTGPAMDTGMKAPLCAQTPENAAEAYPGVRGAIIHSDREARIPAIFTRDAPGKHDIRQSMNSTGGRRHDNARCESMRARMKPELPHERYDMEEMTTDELRTIIRRYFISCRNNRRICSVNGGLPPMVKRQQYCDSLKEAAQGTKSLRKMCQLILTKSLPCRAGVYPEYSSMLSMSLIRCNQCLSLKVYCHFSQACFLRIPS